MTTTSNNNVIVFMEVDTVPTFGRPCRYRTCIVGYINTETSELFRYIGDNYKNEYPGIFGLMKDDKCQELILKEQIASVDDMGDCYVIQDKILELCNIRYYSCGDVKIPKDCTVVCHIRLGE
jgi:hypothetical protein